LNHNRTGFYRVVYDSEHVNDLSHSIQAGKLNPLDRLGLLSDSFEAAKAGYSPTVDALSLQEAYEAEDISVVWDVIAANIGSIRAVMDDEQLRKDLKVYLRRLTAKQVKRLGWEPQAKESHFDKLLRPTVLGLASYGENKAVVQEALRRFKTMKTTEDIHPDLRGVVYGTVAREGGQAEFDKLLQLHNASQSSEERVTLSAALTGFKQPTIIKQALAVMTTDAVRLQDVPYWIAYSFGNRHARDMTWDWMVKHWDWLKDNIGSDLSFFRLPTYAARSYSDKNFIPEFKSFFERNLGPAFERPVNQAVETIEWQAAWRERDLAAIKKYLRQS